MVRDADARRTMSTDILHMGVDYDPYQGREIRGRPRDVITGGRIALRGGPPVTLASGQTSPCAVAVDATSVYWTTLTDPGAVMAVSLAGGTPRTAANGQSGKPSFAATSTVAANAKSRTLSRLRPWETSSPSRAGRCRRCRMSKR